MKGLKKEKYEIEQEREEIYGGKKERQIKKMRKKRERRKELTQK